MMPVQQSWSSAMSGLQTFLDELRQTRDEISMKVHLGSKDIQDQWSDLEAGWERFRSEAELDRPARDVSDTVRILGAERKKGFERVRRTLTP